ncbi:MAG: hypothetical protein LC664_12795 [Flavobacteriales bacterium]|nr:hypothetical protein [Flavobacteriales bacterium]
MCRIFLLLLISTIVIASCAEQEFEKIRISETDNSELYINDGERTALYYLKSVPRARPIGAVVIFPSAGETVEELIEQVDIPQMADESDVLTIIPSINWGTESRNAEIEMLNKIFDEVVSQHKVPRENFVLGGLSNGGMISLAYAQRAVAEPDDTFLTPGGVFGLDVPLDKAHMYAYCQREIERGFSDIGVSEARWMLKRFNQTYGGSPNEFPERYVEASIYSYGAENGGNAQYLKNIPIRMYTDLDVEWLLNERRRDLYDWNGTDIVAMVNDLRMMGNPDANVIVSSGKGERLDGRRHPHSWSIMDNRDCMDWVLKLFSQKGAAAKPE